MRGHTYQNSSDIRGGDAESRIGDVLDEEFKNGLEGQIMPIRESDG